MINIKCGSQYSISTNQYGQIFSWRNYQLCDKADLKPIGNRCSRCMEYFCNDHSLRCESCYNSYCASHISFCSSCGRNICERNTQKPCLKLCKCSLKKCTFCTETCINGKIDWTQHVTQDIWREIQKFIDINDFISLSLSCTRLYFFLNQKNTNIKSIRLKRIKKE